MSGDALSRYRAEQTLAEAAGRATSIRRADRRPAVVLLVLAVLYVSVGVIVGGFGSSLAGGLALVAVVAICLASVVVVLLGRRASSREGSRLFTSSIAIFSLWNVAVIAGSNWLGWWGPHTAEWHFTVSAAMAAMPLFIGAGVLWRRSR